MYKLLSVFFILGIVALGSCKKADPPVDDDNNNDTVPPKVLAFDSLTTANVVHMNETVDINAFADGDDLTYTWTIDIGTLLGTGSVVTFTACCEGMHNITCTVSDKYGATQAKSITIKVIS